MDRKTLLEALANDDEWEHGENYTIELLDIIDKHRLAAPPNGFPKHSSGCAAQYEDAECICGVSDAYALGLRDCVEAAPPSLALDPRVVLDLLERGKVLDARAMLRAALSPTAEPAEKK